jgi:hypothetical protein
LQCRFSLFRPCHFCTRGAHHYWSIDRFVLSQPFQQDPTVKKGRKKEKERRRKETEKKKRKDEKKKKEGGLHFNRVNDIGIS